MKVSSLNFHPAPGYSAWNESADLTALQTEEYTATSVIAIAVFTTGSTDPKHFEEAALNPQMKIRKGQGMASQQTTKMELRARGEILKKDFSSNVRIQTTKLTGYQTNFSR